MRDLLAGKPVRFLHCTTEGDPAVLAGPLKAEGAERLSAYPEQRGINLSLRGCRIRVAAARGGPNGNGTIIEDLRRRGLTINSIGLSLNPGSRGLPLDPTNGVADIEARLIRMNHPYVFLEEPIMLLRAVRLSARMEFALEERTQARMQSARDGNYVERASPAARGEELEAIAYEPDPAAVLRALEKEEWLEAAYGKGVRAAKMDLNGLSRLTPTLESWEQLGLTADSGLVAMPMLLAGLATSDQGRLAQWLPSRHLASDWKKVKSEAAGLEKKILAASAGSSWLRRAEEAIEKSQPEAVVYASVEPANPKAGKKLKDFQNAALQMRQRLPLGILRAQGMAPHSLEAEGILRPWYRRLLSGEAISDAELAEGLRAAVLAVRPAPPQEPTETASRSAKAQRPELARTSKPPTAPTAKPAQQPLAKVSAPSQLKSASPSAKPAPMPATAARGRPQAAPAPANSAKTPQRAKAVSRPAPRQSPARSSPKRRMAKALARKKK